MSMYLSLYKHSSGHDGKINDLRIQPKNITNFRYTMKRDICHDIF